MKINKRIVAVEPGSFFKSGDEYFIEERSFLGYKAYQDYLQKHHPDIKFEVISVSGVQKGLNNLNSLYKFKASDININENALSSWVDEIIDKDASEEIVILSLCRPDLLYLSEAKLKGKIKTVFLVENDFRNKLLMMSSATKGSINKIRSIVGLIKNEFLIRRALRACSGIQFNGVLAESLYSKYSFKSIIFFDHRVESVANNTASKSLSKGLSIGISGRLIDIKGAQYIPALSKFLYELDPEIEIYIMGDGEHRELIINESAPNVKYKGFMPYKEEWEPFVEKNINIMAFLYVQGDPSMTYFESLGRGVPLVGFSNITLDYLVSQKCGWSVERKNPEALARKIYWVNQNRKILENTSRNAIDYMSKNLYSKNVSLRMEHLVSRFSENS